MLPAPGCQQCSAADAAAAWARGRDLAPDREVVAESHLRVTLRRCPSCDQDYAWIFGETIDWADGNDPQEWLLVPVTATEAQRIADAGEPGVAGALGGLSPRRYIRRWFGSRDDASHAQWTSGIVVLPPHDSGDPRRG